MASLDINNGNVATQNFPFSSWWKGLAITAFVSLLIGFVIAFFLSVLFVLPSGEVSPMELLSPIWLCIWGGISTGFFLSQWMATRKYIFLLRADKILPSMIEISPIYPDYLRSLTPAGKVDYVDFLYDTAKLESERSQLWKQFAEDTQVPLLNLGFGYMNDEIESLKNLVDLYDFESRVAKQNSTIEFWNGVLTRQSQ